MKRSRIILCSSLILALICSGSFVIRSIQADTRPNVQLKADKATPRQVEDTTEQAISRDYSSAWQAMTEALENNDRGPLAQNFAGFALDRLTQRVKDQRQNGLTTRIIDHGHKVDAIFYSPDGSAMELHDTASLETEVLDGGSVIHSDQGQIHYVAIMTPDADRWKVRVLESTPALQ